jgi:hypothetical protein
MSTTLPEPDKRSLDKIAIPQTSDRPSADQVDDEPIVIKIGAVAFLRTMWSILWTAFRHPMTTSYIDVTTGEVVEPYENEI